MINSSNLIKCMKAYGEEGPFDHCVIDNFFDYETLRALCHEFPDFESDVWHEYNNPIEIKKTCNNWNLFPPATYSVFEYLNSSKFISLLSETTGIAPLFSDPGLNGGGWHIHKSGGKLNTHLDYSLHPKLGRQRVINILVYMTEDWKPDWGGNLGLWSQHETKQCPGDLKKSIEPKFNRAVIFNTTQNSWHGLPEPITCPDDIFRKSLAVYYLTVPSANVSERGKALFAPHGAQANDPSVLDLIEKRSSVSNAQQVYNLEIGNESEATK